MIAGISALSFVLLAAQRSPAGASRVTGRVTDASSGAPISGARVALMMVVDEPGGAPIGRPPRESTTDATGAFRFDGVEPAQYVLNVEKTGFASYPDVLGDGVPERLTLDGKVELPQLNIALSRGAVITGKILNAAGEAEADLSVAALRRTDQVGLPDFVPVGQAQTNDLGEFRIAGLAAGDYIVLASIQSRGPFDAVPNGSTTTLAPTYFPGTLDQRASRVTSLTAGQAVDGLEFAIKTVAAFHVSGVAVDSAGHPSRGAIVMLIPDWKTSGSFEPMTSIAADDGTFTIGNVIPGTYQIAADASAGGGSGGGGMFAFTSETSITGATSAATVTVASADVTGLRVAAKDK